MAANVRKGVAEGRSDCIPIFLSDIPKLFHRGIYKPDIALIQVQYFSDFFHTDNTYLWQTIGGFLSRISNGKDSN